MVPLFLTWLILKRIDNGCSDLFFCFCFFHSDLSVYEKNRFSPRNLWKSGQGFTPGRWILSQSFIARDWTDARFVPFCCAHCWRTCIFQSPTLSRFLTFQRALCFVLCIVMNWAGLDVDGKTDTRPGRWKQRKSLCASTRLTLV